MSGGQQTTHQAPKPKSKSKTQSVPAKIVEIGVAIVGVVPRLEAERLEAAALRRVGWAFERARHVATHLDATVVVVVHDVVRDVAATIHITHQEYGTINTTIPHSTIPRGSRQNSGGEDCQHHARVSD